MWQNLNKFFKHKEESFPKWLLPLVHTVKNKAEIESASWHITEILLDKPVGHRVHFLINGIECYAVRDSKNKFDIIQVDKS